jgi:hypothetical protein
MLSLDPKLLLILLTCQRPALANRGGLGHVFNFRLTTASAATGRVIPRLDLALDQPLERPRDLPFLIAFSAKWQRASFLYHL